jgi:ABC-type transport system involved in multi-copper enzyme maturation permease subunit
VILTFNSVWVATGIFFSTHLNRTTTAVVCNLMLVLAVFIGVPMFLGIIESLARGNGQVFDRILSTYQPYYYLGLLLDLRPYRYQMQPGLVTVSLFSGITYGQFIVWTIFVGLVHLAIAGWILTWCAMDFNRVTGRAPQTDPLPPRDPADAPATAL